MVRENVQHQKIITMAKKLNGMMILSKIPRDLIGQTQKGEKCIFVDIVPRKGGADKYGNTHSIQIYDKEAKQVIYLGNLKTVEFGQKADNAPASPAPTGNNDEDLPW
jgi:hypothetical protein